MKTSFLLGRLLQCLLTSDQRSSCTRPPAGARLWLSVSCAEGAVAIEALFAKRGWLIVEKEGEHSTSNWRVPGWMGSVAHSVIDSVHWVTTPMSISHLSLWFEVSIGSS